MNEDRSRSVSARRSRRATSRLLLGPVLVVLAVSLPKIWQGDFNVDTGWYAAIALQAYRGVAEAGLDSWWTLQGSGIAGQSVPYFNKPPVAFWLNGLSLAVFGPTIWAARLGSVAAVALTVAATTLLVRRHSGPGAARAAGLVLATTIPFVALGRSFSLDAWLTLFLVVTAGAVLGGREGERGWPRTLAGGLALGLALLVKPLVAMLGLLAVVIWLAMRRDRARLGRSALVLVIGLAIAGAWHGAMAVRFPGEFWGQYFGREIADRAAGDRSAAAFNAGARSLLYYPRVLLETTWPWLATTALAVVALLRKTPPARGLRRSRPSDRDWLVFGLIWSAVWLVSLSLFADKRPRYLAPVFPVWAWMSALWLTRGWGAPAGLRAAWRRAARLVPVVAVAAAVIVSVLPVRVHKPRDAHWAGVLAWIDAHPEAILYQGGFVGQRLARVYLHTGRWPSLTAGAPGREGAVPRAGAHLLYHTRDGLAPGANEEVVLRADKLVITRLMSEPWAPVPTPDPGE